ncbi:MAG: hypothetical protein SGJ09_06955 [Phycisphaerae bacterium]|nr:hypothetical protein [Phycisphaerae bacterium]
MNPLGNPFGNSLGRLAAQTIGAASLRDRPVRPVLAPRFAPASERRIADETMAGEPMTGEPGDAAVARDQQNSRRSALQSTSVPSTPHRARSVAVTPGADAVRRAPTPVVTPSKGAPERLAPESIVAGTQRALAPSSRATAMFTVDRAPTLMPRAQIASTSIARGDSNTSAGRGLGTELAPSVPNISIEVSIGRIELRLPPAAPATTRAPAARLPSVTLDSYLAARERHRQ